ncbi:MAG: hypothetical protein H0V29_01300 [Thermoleophilaceae bacterium]|nr:hypothetical protein [Thermoleophilaceae bacterium]
MISWNLFHGRDVAGGERRELLPEFGDVLAGLHWEIALLQECPPRFVRPLAERCGAGGATALTSRNWGAFLRTAAARRRPDLMKSGEGGCNAILFRVPWRAVAVRRMTFALLPERRRMIWMRLDGPEGALCVANLHATAHDPSRAAAEVERAARCSLDFSAGLPLLFGGDLNLRVRERADVFDGLERGGLTGRSAPDRVDHLLAAPEHLAEPARALPAHAREIGTPPLRLSDHAPLTCAVALL